MSPIIDDLRIEAEIPPRAQRPGTGVVVKLRFLNVGTRARTLYLIRDESYRFGQSTFKLYVSPLETLVQPPRRGGYVPTPADFHPLPARGILEFSQTLQLPRDIKAGKYRFQWVYENQVDCMPAGTPTPAADQAVPPIWTGRNMDENSITVSRPLIVRPT